MVRYEERVARCGAGAELVYRRGHGELERDEKREPARQVPRRLGGVIEGGGGGRAQGAVMRGRRA